MKNWKLAGISVLVLAGSAAASPRSHRNRQEVVVVRGPATVVVGRAQHEKTKPRRVAQQRRKRWRKIKQDEARRRRASREHCEMRVLPAPKKILYRRRRTVIAQPTQHVYVDPAPAPAVVHEPEPVYRAPRSGKERAKVHTRNAVLALGLLNELVNKGSGKEDARKIGLGMLALNELGR
jgi:hypothetical protein